MAIQVVTRHEKGEVRTYRVVGSGADTHEQLVERRGTRAYRLGTEDYVITIDYLPDGGWIERERFAALGHDWKVVCREHPPAGLYWPLPLRLTRHHFVVSAQVETFGDSEGADREPWARFIIADESTLRGLLGDTDLDQLKANDHGFYLEIEGSLAPSFPMIVTGRPITVTEIGAITFTFTPNRDPLAAYIRKVKWAEGWDIKPA